jgi:succinate dehydrogenase / fumarate reductase, cytochrome b subunit
MLLNSFIENLTFHELKKTMANDSLLLNSTVGRKILMGLTGLFLAVFLVTHLSGNLLLFSDDGGRAFNEYTLFMTTNMFIRIVEIVLVVGFVVHIWLAVKLTSKNNASRPQGYAVNKVNETASIYSRNMGVTGSIILIFLILHLRTFWFTFHYGEIPVASYPDGAQLKDMFYVVQAAFSELWYVVLYVISMILLGGHLIHGVQSALRSLGLNNKSWAPALTRFSMAFAIAISLGFASMPVIFYLRSI